MFGTIYKCLTTNGGTNIHSDLMDIMSSLSDIKGRRSGHPKQMGSTHQTGRELNKTIESGAVTDVRGHGGSVDKTSLFLDIPPPGERISSARKEIKFFPHDSKTSKILEENQAGDGSSDDEIQRIKNPDTEGIVLKEEAEDGDSVNDQKNTKGAPEKINRKFLGKIDGNEESGYRHFELMEQNIVECCMGQPIDDDFLGKILMEHQKCSAHVGPHFSPRSNGGFTIRQSFGSVLDLILTLIRPILEERDRLRRQHEYDMLVIKRILE